MLFVNFLGGYHVVPAVFKHHNTYCSYADTIMPQFFFAVGFAYRLTFLRRLAAGGFVRAAGAAIKRNFGLILLGFVLYHLDGHVQSWTELQTWACAVSSPRLSGASSFRRSSISRSRRSGSCR